LLRAGILTPPAGPGDPRCRLCPWGRRPLRAPRPAVGGV